MKPRYFAYYFIVALAFMCVACLPERKSREQLRAELAADGADALVLVDAPLGDGAQPSDVPGSEPADTAMDAVAVDAALDDANAPNDIQLDVSFSETLDDVDADADQSQLADVADACSLPASCAPDAYDAEVLVADATATDTGPAAITSCLGHCGILLTDIGNPCSCHPSCKDAGNCCADFTVACSCATGGDAACDDGDECTIDSCKSGFCLQLPIPSKSCCHADAECKGGDKCTVPKCIQGSCAPQTTNCDDGLACTNDACDPATGDCVHKQSVGQCVIDGACHKAGDVDPNSTGCSVCDPSKSTSTWSAKAGTCSIDGMCWKTGDVGPAGSCAICDAAKAPSAWTIKAGSCLIDGACAKALAVQDGSSGCATCDPAKSPSAWTPKAAATACDDGTSCTTSDKCDGKGACKGAAVANCCITDADCANATYSDGAPGPCEQSACNKGSGKCAKVPVPSCCTAGVCCDVGQKTLKEKNTPCSTFVMDKVYQCSGDDAQMREIFSGCTGSDASKCSTGTPGYGPWKTVKTCTAETVCKLGDPSQVPGCAAK